MNFYKQTSMTSDPSSLFFVEENASFESEYLDSYSSQVQYGQFDFSFENMYMSTPKTQVAESSFGKKASSCSSVYENASTHNDVSTGSQICEKSEFDTPIVNENTDLNKLVEELIFAEAQETAFECTSVTPVSSKSKRMWKRDGAKNTLEIEYQKCKDWADVKFRTELGSQIGYTAHQVYKWWAYRLTKDGMKVSNFSRKHK